MVRFSAVGRRIGPPGRHRVRLDAITEGTGKFGPTLEWHFVIAGGLHAGCYFVRTTGQDLTLGTVLGDMLEALYGRRLSEGDQIDPVVDLVGQEFELFAVPGSGSGGVFQSVRPVSTKGAK